MARPNTLQTLRDVAAASSLDAESAPSAGAGMDVQLERETTRVAVRVKTMVTSGTPTGVSLRVYADVSGTVVVLGDIQISGSSLSEPKPFPVYEDFGSARGLSVKVQSFTAGTSPRVTELEVDYIDLVA